MQFQDGQSKIVFSQTQKGFEKVILPTWDESAQEIRIAPKNPASIPPRAIPINLQEGERHILNQSRKTLEQIEQLVKSL